MSKMGQPHKLPKLRWDCGGGREVVEGKVEFLKMTQPEEGGNERTKRI